MMDARFMVFPALAATAGLSLWGWGWLARRCARVAALPVVVTIGAGLALVISLGGVLNVARLAFSPAFDGLLLAGVALAVAGAWPARRQLVARPSLGAVAAAVPLLAAAWFLTAYLVPQAAYNHNDDFEKYFTHPVKMVALGTLPPNFLGSLGWESLGGQAVLQAFAAAHFPLAYLGTVDAVFCLLLCVAIAGYAFPPGRWGLGAVAAELCVLAINPQLVNISSLYSGTALMMTALWLFAAPGVAEADRRPSPLLLGLVYAGLLALKTSFVPFIAVHALAVVALGPFEPRRRWIWSAQVAGWSALFLAPWLLLHAPLYLAPAQPPPVLPPAGPPLRVSLFSTAPLGYRGTQLDYTVLALTALALATFTDVARQRGWIARSWAAASLVTAGLSAALVYLAIAVYFAPELFTDPSGTRYTCPILIAVVPISIRLFATLPTAKFRRVAPAVAVGLGLLPVVLFWPSLRGRARQWIRYRVALAYFHKGSEEDRREMIGYVRDVLAGPARARLARIQALVPAGAPFAAWIAAPFLLDFRRNPITHVDLAGLAARWAHVPVDVHYFLFQYRGFATRTPGDFIDLSRSSGLADRIEGTRALDFIAGLNQRLPTAEVLYHDHDYVLLHWRQPWPAPAPSPH